ncbi:MAG TPA: hypothetical protein DEU93_00080, partial [Chitinophagaceae bacterium]|nr:hypothetical protein [Chitinophagaceae bacterium]
MIKIRNLAGAFNSPKAGKKGDALYLYGELPVKNQMAWNKVYIEKKITHWGQFLRGAPFPQ